MSYGAFKWHYMDITGRIGRKKFWLFYALPMVFVSFIFEAGVEFYGMDMMRFVLLLFIPVICMLVCGYIKRQHDLGYSGWWVFLSFIPILGVLYCIVYLGCVPGDTKNNKYGKAINTDELGV